MKELLGMGKKLPATQWGISQTEKGVPGKRKRKREYTRRDIVSRWYIRRVTQSGSAVRGGKSSASGGDIHELKKE